MRLAAARISPFTNKKPSTGSAGRPRLGSQARNEVSIIKSFADKQGLKPGDSFDVAAPAAFRGDTNSVATNSLADLPWWAIFRDPALQDFTARLTALRRAHPALHADRFLSGAAHDETLLPDVAWLQAGGQAMADPHWGQAGLLTAVFHAEGDRVALVFNQGAAAAVTLPEPRDGMAWRVDIDSATDLPPVLLDDATLACPPRAVLAVVEVPAPSRRRNRREKLPSRRPGPVAIIFPWV